MFEHFGQRLKRDLKQIVDRRIEASEASSGALMRVRISIGAMIAELFRLMASRFTVNRCRSERGLP